MNFVRRWDEKENYFHLVIRVDLSIFFVPNDPILAEPRVYYGKVVGTEFSVIQVGGDDGKVSVFWMRYKTRLDSRIPFFGDRVRIESIRDRLGRKAVTRITISGR